MADLHDWSETALWKEIERRGTESRSYVALRNAMPIVQETLRAGLPSSPDFTLHDNEHGFRVAELAAKLLQDEGLSGLSDFEVSLLLLACYCHDIGMSPAREKVRNHHHYLLTADEGLLTEPEVADLQRWLDQNRGGLTPPIAKDQVTHSGLLKAEEITAYYARSKHNDWSEEWIRGSLDQSANSFYTGWIDDLVTLCRSHHEGLAQLRHSRYDARLVGSPSSPLNLRFLAAALRVADVMEFAPERTPEVILKHRGIAPSSRIYWYKDHAISFSIDPANHGIFFSAQTQSAVVHKAVLMTAEWVDQELSTCSSLQQEGAFRQGTIPEGARGKYSWIWPARLATDIRERDGSFVYIEGAFRPDHKRILDLLSGTALYGDPVVAVRELLQNSMDAVKEQMAYERLSTRAPSSEDIRSALVQLHSIRLSFYRDAEGYWLECEDDGSGMTKSIIENALLVSGSDVRGDLRALERDARAAGFGLERTGQFGIGVLSYFMISDKMIILTRRSGEAGDTDGTAWRFETEGVGGFGELRQDSRGSRGTRVLLRIKTEIVRDRPKEWIMRVATYIKETVQYLPCRLEVHDEVGKQARLSMGPGWAAGAERYNSDIVSTLIDTDSRASELVTRSEQEQLNSDARHVRDQLKKAENLLEWHGPVDFVSDDPGAIGRVWLPYFLLPGGVSSTFMNVDDSCRLSPPDVNRGHVVDSFEVESWRGIRVGISPAASAIVEVDYKTGRRVSVDRHSFVEGESRETLKLIKAAVHELWSGFLTSSVDSVYHEANVLASPLSQDEMSRRVRNSPAWAMWVGSVENTVWGLLEFPLFSLGRVSFYTWNEERFLFQGEPIIEAGWIGTERGNQSLRLLSLFGGGRVVHIGMEKLGIAGLHWASADAMKVIDGSISSATSDFPPEWGDVFAIRGPTRPIYNSGHLLTLDCGNERIGSLSTPAPATIAKDIRAGLRSRGAALSYLRANAARAPKFWIFLRESHSGEFQRLLRLAGIDGRGLLKLAEASNMSEWYPVLDLYELAFSDNLPERRAELPVTSDEWKLGSTRRSSA